MKRLFTSFLLYLFLLLIHNTVYPQWTRCNGIYGGSLITAISADKDKIIVGTATKGVFFSEDKGKNWREKNIGLSKKEIYSILIKDNNVFVGTFQDGLYKSTDNGNSWQHVTSKWTGYTTVISIDETIFVNNADKGILRSNDDGVKWDTLAREFVEKSILNLKTNGRNLYFNNFDGDIYKSSDNGETWQQILMDGSSFPLINFAVEGDLIFIHTTQGFFLSIDEGQTWKQIRRDDTKLYDSEFVSIIDGILYVGTVETLYKVRNGGFEWKSLTRSMNDFSGASCITGYSSKLYIGTTRGLYESTEIDTNWLPLGPSAHKINKIVKKGDALYAGTENGLFVSEDRGEHWRLTHKWYGQTLNNNSLQFKDLCLADTILLASTSLGVCKIEKDEIIKKFINETAGILALGYQENVIYISIQNVGIIKSTDNGSTWQTTEIKSGSFSTLYCNSKIVFAIEGSSIYSSSDKGETWNLISSPQQVDSKTIYGICTLGNTIIIATEVGIFFSDNNGEKWKKPFTDLPSLPITSILQDGGTIFIGLNQGVYFSNDEGRSWLQLGDKFSDKTISTMYADDSTLFVGTIGESTWMYRRDLLQTINTQSNPITTKLFSCNPNPTSEHITVHINTPGLLGSRCEICTLQGEAIHSFDIVADTTAILINDLCIGIYLLTVHSNTHVYTVPLHIIR